MVLLTLIYKTQQSFSPRTSFVLNNKTVLRWFPGHMGKGLRQMQQKLKSVDCIIEVHDARIPFSGRNPQSFQTISGLRPHLLVYNKRDLANEDIEPQIIKRHNELGMNNVIFTNARDNKCCGIASLIPLVRKQISSSDRYNRRENLDFCLMVIGVPNVGKSSMINALRNKFLLRGGGAATGAKPGITVSVGEKIKISSDPSIYVLDTPGILTPSVPSVDVGLKLALCATIPDKEVGIELVADYLLYWLNKQENYRYIDYIGIESPSNSISEILAVFAVRNNMMIKVRSAEGPYMMKPNFQMAADNFVNAFRKGLFGRLTLDIDVLNSKSGKNPLVKKSYLISKRQRT